MILLGEAYYVLQHEIVNIGLNQQFPDEELFLAYIILFYTKFRMPMNRHLMSYFCCKDVNND